MATVTREQKAIERLRTFARLRGIGGCRVISIGDACECVLCDLDAVAAALSAPPADGEAREHQERLYAMAVDDGETWDLSENDQAACNYGADCIGMLSAVISERDALAALPPPADPQLAARLERAETALEHVRRQAGIWKQEARTQKATVDGVGAIVGLPDYGPIVAAVEALAMGARKCHTCGYTLVRCNDCKDGGAVACCPDCDHREEPRPADPPHDCEAWRLEGLGCARCNKADPPALVALVREWQRKQRGCDIENTAAAYAELDIAEAELLAYPLPAAPPVPETPQPGEMPPSSTWGDIGPQPKGWPDGNNAVQWKPKPDCVIGVYCQRHGFIHGQEAEELRERLEELGNKAVNRVLDEVDARDSLAYLEATNEPTPPDAAPAAPPQEDQ